MAYSKYEGSMRAKRPPIILLLVLGVPVPLAAPALGRPLQELQVAILRAGMAGGHSFRIDLATTGLAPQMAEPAELSLDVQVEEQAIHAALPLRRMPSRFPVVLDLA